VSERASGSFLKKSTKKLLFALGYCDPGSTAFEEMEVFCGAFLRDKATA
jgi:hypothetical protein